MTATRSDKQIFDLLLLGLSWVYEDAGNLTGWTANGVLQTMRQLGAISDQQHQFITTQSPQSLCKAAIQQSCVIPATRQGRRGLVKTVASTDKLLVVMQHTALFVGDMMLTPRGYRLLPSNKGQVYALGIADEYQRLIQGLTQDAFRGQWLSHARQMRGLYALQRQPTPQTEG